MSRLYVKTSSDATKTIGTKRGHRWANAEIAFNFGGGNSAEGWVEMSAVVSENKQVVTYEIGLRLPYTGGYKKLGYITLDNVQNRYDIGYVDDSSGDLRTL